VNECDKHTCVMVFGSHLHYWCSFNDLRFTHSGQVFGPASLIIVCSSNLFIEPNKKKQYEVNERDKHTCVMV
jgi:hypothetical protein